MIAVDSNILIHAHREESLKHVKAKKRILDLAEGTSPWAIPVFCLAEFLRVITHPKVFNPPHQISQACQSLRSLLSAPSVRILRPGEEFTPIFFQITTDLKLRGNLVFDAQIVALCLEFGVRRILTEDSDFKKFNIQVESL